MKKINLKNIKSFLEGNYGYYYDKFVGKPKYIKEQIQYRYSLCKDDCIPNNKCIHCGCPPVKKAFSTYSCNEGKRFPDLMDEKRWGIYKKDNNINND